MSSFVRLLTQRVPGLTNKRTLGVAAAFFAKAVGTGLAFLFSILLARLLGPAGTGVYFLALTIVSIGATIARLGLENAVLRFASVAHDQGDRLTLAALYQQSMGLVFVAGLAVVLVIWGVVQFLPINGGKSVLLFMLLALIPVALIPLQAEFFKATGAPGTAIFVQVAILPIILVMGAAIFFWKGGASTQNIAVFYAISAVLSVLFSGAIWNHHKPGLWRERGEFNTRVLLRTSLPLLWVASMYLVMSWTDILVLGAWTDSATVGVYGVATRVATLTAFILIAVNSVVAPQFAALYAQGSHNALARLAQRSTGWAFLAALPIILSLLLFPDWVLQFFGNKFLDGAAVLRILSFGQLVSVALGAVGYLLIMTGHERLMKNITIMSALLNLIGNLILVPFYGAEGAAVSTAFSLAFMSLLSYILVIRRLNINTLGYLFEGLLYCRNLKLLK